MLEQTEPMTAAIFQVELRQENNDLDAMIQVISLTQSMAKRFVLNKFFVSGSWDVVKVKKIRDLKDSREKHIV